METHNIKPVAVISGGLGVVGLAITQQLVADGFFVAPLYYETPEAVVKEKLESFLSSDVSPYRLDLANYTEVTRVLGEIEREHGPIVVGVHAANGPILRKKVSELTPETFREQFAVGLFGGFNFFSAIASLMKQRKNGTLIGITTAATEDTASVAGSFGGYISTKFALKGLLSELRGELKSYNIHVYAVAPGFINGGLNADLPPRLVEFIKEKAPNGRLTEVKDVAQAVLSLCVDPKDTSVDGLTLLVP